MVRKNLGMAEDGAHLAIERGFIHFHEPVYSVLALVSYFVDSIYVNLQQIGDTGEGLGRHRNLRHTLGQGPQWPIKEKMCSTVTALARLVSRSSPWTASL